MSSVDCVEVQITLLATHAGGRRTPIATGYRPDWDLGVIDEDGRSMLNGAHLELLDCDAIEPGGAGAARLSPFRPAYWAHVTVGMRLPMHEGPNVLGHAVIARVVLAKSETATEGSLRLPVDKGDVEVSAALRDAPLALLEQHVQELLAWLQDMNWPVARDVADALARCGVQLVEPVRAVLKSDDDIWKAWTLDLLVHVSPNVRRALRADIERIALSPTVGEHEEEVHERAVRLLELMERE